MSKLKNHNVSNTRVVYNQYFLEFVELMNYAIFIPTTCTYTINNYFSFHNNPLYVLAHEGHLQGELGYKGIHL
jgi:hypothetical protein